MDIYINHFLIDRQYYIKVNDYKSPTYQSAVGIPQGSVISHVLCNLYTGDAMEGVKGLHAEFADDATVKIVIVPSVELVRRPTMI